MSDYNNNNQSVELIPTISKPMQKIRDKDEEEKDCLVGWPQNKRELQKFWPTMFLIYCQTISIALCLKNMLSVLYSKTMQAFKN